MRKAGLLFCILFISLISTACINNLAIQELNEIGKKYLEQGEVDEAIARFQSSVDLDENLYESRYNLGVAYIKKEDYINAIKTLEKASEINPELPDIHYSLAVALEGEALKLDNFSEEILNDNEEKQEEDNTEFTPELARDYLDYAAKSIQEYKLYLKLSKNSSNDKEQIEERINKIKKVMAQSCEKYGINPTVFPIDLTGVLENDNTSAQ